MQGWKRDSISSVFSVILLLTVLPTNLPCRSNVIFVTDEECPLDVQILNSDTYWCSGSGESEYGPYLWDMITIIYAKVGLANLNATKHSLNQLILTIDRVGTTGGLAFLKSENLTSERNLPLILFPHSYCVHNFSCLPYQSINKIDIEVDGEWFEFTLNELFGKADTYMGATYWPEHWSKVVHWTEYQPPQVNWVGIIICGGLVLIIWIIQRRKRRIE